MKTNKVINQAELVDRIWKSSGVTRHVVDTVVVEMVAQIQEAMIAETDVKIYGLCRFETYDRAACTFLNPHTGVSIPKPAGRRARMKVSTVLHARLNSGS